MTTPALATGSASSQLTGIAGRGVASTRGHHFIVDSPLPLGGPNEEINPLDLFLTSLATCATFICETAAAELSIPLQTVSAEVEGDFDARGLCGDPVDPHVQQLRVKLTMVGPSEEQAQTLVSAFQSRCPIYTTMSRAAPIDISLEIH